MVRSLSGFKKRVGKQNNFRQWPRAERCDERRSFFFPGGRLGANSRDGLAPSSNLARACEQVRARAFLNSSEMVGRISRTYNSVRADRSAAKSRHHVIFHRVVAPRKSLTYMAFLRMTVNVWAPCGHNRLSRPVFGPVRRHVDRVIPRLCRRIEYADRDARRLVRRKVYSPTSSWSTNAVPICRSVLD